MASNQLYTKLINEAIKNKVNNPADFLVFKKYFCSQNYSPQPTNADIRVIYEQLITAKKIKRSQNLEKALKSRLVRTQSGVAVIAVLTKPYSCPGDCLYCPTEKEMPKSYLSNEPAVMRAIMVKFDPYHQVQTRIKSLELNGHDTSKIELIVMGGTFSHFPKSYQQRFISECFRACNEYPKRVHPVKSPANRSAATLQFNRASKRNEKSRRRIIGLTLETRPDYINEEEIINFRKLGCTRVELGVQSIFDDVLKKNKRGHRVSETIKATQLLKEAGFKINYHIMPGLFGSTLKKDFDMFKKLFSSPDFQPDMLKIYPTIVTKNSQLYKLWKSKKYHPLTDKKLKEFIIKVKKEIIPYYTRITRLIRDVPTTSIIAGPTVPNLRQIIASDVACKCIRCREVRAGYNIKEKIKLFRTTYPASHGKEIFLSFESSDRKKPFSLLRLRINSKETLEKHYIKALQNAAIIREIHTYGKLAPINTKDKKSPQHIGLGKKLITEAEKITKKEFNLSKIAVISGVGVRDYYRKLGYRLKDEYMVKNI